MFDSFKIVVVCLVVLKENITINSKSVYNFVLKENMFKYDFEKFVKRKVDFRHVQI
jgi:hypothetical protein